MGLDVYAVRPGDPSVTGHGTLSKPITFQWMVPEDIEPFENMPRGFPAGVFWPSDSDITGFRGKVYEGWVSKHLDTSLYALLDPDEVQVLADALDRWLAEHPDTEIDLGDGHPQPRAVIESLGHFFKAAAAQRLWFFPDF
ncbi:hypothetical protein [Nonomuraea guangzhouensis]|uniref:DUF4253 domain-containing protein n=1 Tax=Nonomuraea guangzhouensis TaxID=1291555 RepID=A0ABW4GYJ1_9ACTN|nr:hypothetical protein [Nonomuraea guangzhouensis]